MAKMTLPNPNDYGAYELSDGSRIYPSGGTMPRSKHMPVHPGKYYLWVKRGVRKEGEQSVAYGDIIMDSKGPRYFDGPQEALDEMNRNCRRG